MIRGRSAWPRSSRQRRMAALVALLADAEHGRECRCKHSIRRDRMSGRATWPADPDAVGGSCSGCWSPREPLPVGGLGEDGALLVDEGVARGGGEHAGVGVGDDGAMIPMGGES